MATRRTPAAKNPATTPRRDARPGDGGIPRRAAQSEWPGRALEADDLAARPESTASSVNGDAPPPPGAVGEIAASPTPPPMLTLLELVPEREPVNILGTQYEIVSIDEFGEYEKARLKVAWDRSGELMARVHAGEELPPAERQAITEAQFTVIQTAVPGVSRAELMRLLPGQRSTLVDHFFALVGRVAKQLAEAEAAARSIGASISPASSGSTAPATPPPGSTSPPPS